MTTSVRLLAAIITMSALPGCIDPPKPPYVNVHSLVEKVDELQARAEQGSAEDQYQLGMRYETQVLDYREAARWYRMAALQRHGDALYRLCVLSDIGRGMPQDHHDALRWCRLAADQDHARAMFTIGIHYEKGRSVSRDPVQAHQWYNLSAAYGYNQAAKWRDRLALDMTPTQIAQAQLLARNWKPNAQAIPQEQ
jgi:TPR repeat protein